MSDKDKPVFHIVSNDSSSEGPPSKPPPDTLEAQGANDEALRIKVAKLEDEHRDLDLAISSLEERMPYDRVAIARMKKRKLALKDELTRLHAMLLPDIIA